MATDSSGAFVTGLHTSDFSLNTGLGETPVEGVQEIKPFLLPPDSTGRQKQPIFLVLDKVSLHAPVLGSVVRSVLRFLAQCADQDDPVTLLTIDSEGVKVIHNLITPSSVLTAALQELDKKTHVLGGVFESAPANIDESLKQRVGMELSSLESLNELAKPLMGLTAASLQMEALRHIGTAGKRIPGRKAIVWITGGVPLHFEDTTEMMTYGRWQTDADDKRYTIEFESAVEALNEGQTSLYPLGPDVFRGNPINDSEYWRDSGLTQIARSTGGELLRFDQDVTRSAQFALRHCTSYYLLAHELGPAPKKVKWTKVQVTTKRPDVRVQTMNGFFALP